jgi:predicted Zn-dependent protease
MEETEDMEKHLKKAAKKFPNSPFVLTQVGQFLITQKEYKEALPYFKKITRQQPNSAEGRLGLAQSFFHTGKQKESYKHFLKACMLNKSQMLWAFKQAKSILNQKSKFKLASTFERGITKCFLKAKHNKKNTQP